MNARPPNFAIVVRLMTVEPQRTPTMLNVGGQRYRDGGYVLGVSVIGRHARIEPDHAHEVFGERDGDGAE